MILFGVGARVSRSLLLAALVVCSAAAPGLAAGLPVRVTPVSGEPFTAELEGFSEAGVTLLVNGQQRTVPRAEVSRIERTERVNVTGPSLTVALANGSRLKSEGVSIEGPEATIQLRRQPDFSVPVSQLRWIRFRPPSPTVDDAWLGLLGDPRAEDLLVIRRSTDTIDQVSGVVLGADATTVRFSVGDRQVPAPVAKLEGIVFGSPAGNPQPPEGAIGVLDTLGSQWSVASLEMVDGPAASGSGAGQPPAATVASLRMELAEGQQRLLPLDQVASIRFEGNSQWLALESPVESRYAPLIELPVAAERSARWLGPRVEGDRDLVLRSRSSLTYRVDPKFSTFASRIVPDPSVAAGGGADVRILADGQVVWSESILPADKPRGVELDLGPARRITLEVDYGQGESRSDVGDVIRFVEPRLLQ